MNSLAANGSQGVMACRQSQLTLMHKPAAEEATNARRQAPGRLLYIRAFPPRVARRQNDKLPPPMSETPAPGQIGCLGLACYFTLQPYACQYLLEKKSDRPR
jgi:hypothetical protein